MSFQFPYRAIICGEEHILKGWRGRKLITDKGIYLVNHIYSNWQIENHRLLEIAMIRFDGNDGWLVNDKPLSLLEKLTIRTISARHAGRRERKDHEKAVSYSREHFALFDSHERQRRESGEVALAYMLKV
jgi:hypothetical protein